MNGELARAIALVTYGNVALHLPEEKTPELVGRCPAFQYLESLTFNRLRMIKGILSQHHLTQEERIARSTQDWFRALRAGKAQHLWLIERERPGEMPPHLAAAFGQEGGWAIEVDFQKRVEIWTSQTIFLPLRESWDVRYTGISWLRASLLTSPPLDAALARLLSAIETARDFAARIGQRYWVEHFTEILDLDDPAYPAQAGTLFPTVGYPPEARRVLDVAAATWVFGGIGSWNDLPLEDSPYLETYQEVTATLYHAMMQAFIAAANAFDVTLLHSTPTL